MTEHDELSQMLRDKVETFDVRPSDLPQVEARARRIRARRRTAAVSAVAAAVVAVAVPTALALRPGDPSGSPARPSPSAPTASPGTPEPTVSTLSQIPEGREPKIGWRQGSVVHLADGRTLSLPDGIWGSFAPYRGGLVAASTNGIADEVVVVGSDGGVVSRGQGSGPVVSPDGTRVTWWSHSSHGNDFVSGPTSATGGGTDTTVPTTARRPKPIGYLDGQLVYAVDSDTGGVAVSCGASCTIGLSGITMVRAVDSDRHLLAGFTSSDCPTKVFHAPRLTGTSSRTVPVTSSWPCVQETPDGFSPDGSELTLVHQGGDGRTDGIDVRDSDSGRLRMSYRAPRGVQVGFTAWEDDTHVLVVAYSAPDTEWTILRLGLDRSVERAAPVVAGDDSASPFAFGAQP